MSVDPARAKSLFLTASDLSLEERAAYLDRECGGDAELRERVEALLRAEDGAPMPPDPGEATRTYRPEEAPRTEDYADPEEAPPTEDYADPNAHVGTVLAGKYKLMEEIGEGGMGSVFMALQTEPVKRAVAVKVIKAGMSSKSVLARFEAERQALAMMDHPNIAKVLDAGTTEGGRPFFVMELVKGVPITEYCDEHRLTPRQRLELFVPVCQAIQHAHQKGVIHRDIKPSNVLIALYDDRPVPKVIDFGVAKAAGSVLTDKTLMTGFGAVVGTPEHMSPEQASLNNLDIDTRSDVYALGVLLYELLTGTTPVDRKSLGAAAMLEILRIVREVEAPRPSARLSMIDTLASVAANRGTEPGKLSRLLRGELDWVVLKALEKNRSRRYETANALSRDVQRYLADEVVEARPPSAAYRLRKFFRRHKGQVIAAGLVLLALVAGVIGTTAGLIRAEGQRRIAAERAEGERLAKEDAEAKRAEAERENRIAEAVKDFLKYKLLLQGDVTAQADALLEAGGRAEQAKPNPTIRELLDRAAEELTEEKIEESFPDQPLVQAEILMTVGYTYRAIGRHERAIELLRRSLALRKQHLGPDHPDTLKSISNLARAYRDVRKLDQALPLFEQTLRRMKVRIGPDHPDTLLCMAHLAATYQVAGNPDDALPLFEETLRRMKAKLGPEHPDTLSVMGSLGEVHRMAGNLDKALPLLKETLRLQKAELGPDHPHTYISVHNLALAHQASGDSDEALPLFEEALRFREAKLDADHPDLCPIMNNLALAYKDAGRLEKALSMYERALRLTEATFGPGDPRTLIVRKGKAVCHLKAGEPHKAVLLFEQVLESQKVKPGPDHPDTIITMSNLALAYQGVGEPHKAVLLFEQVLEAQKVEPGPDHPDTLQTMNNLAAAYWRTKELDKSIPLFEKLLPLREKESGPDHLKTLTVVVNLGVNYRDADRLAEAIPLLDRAYRASKRYPPLHFAGYELLKGYVWSGMTTEAADLVDNLVADAEKQCPPDSPELAQRLVAYGLLMLEAKAYPKAEVLLRDCLAIRAKQLPDSWLTFNTMSLLGGAMLGQKKYADAGPPLLKGYEGMKQREKTIPPQARVRLTEAIDRLIELCTATEKPDEVKKWQAERAKYPDLATPAKKE